VGSSMRKRWVSRVPRLLNPWQVVKSSRSAWSSERCTVLWVEGRVAGITCSGNPLSHVLMFCLNHTACRNVHLEGPVLEVSPLTSGYSGHTYPACNVPITLPLSTNRHPPAPHVCALFPGAPDGRHHAGPVHVPPGHHTRQPGSNLRSVGILVLGPSLPST
jgi:hypothetical protein